MAKEDENAGVACDKTKSDFEKGREIGRIEGMIAYQKHLIENMQKENEGLTRKLEILKCK